MPWIVNLDPEGTYCCHLSPKELREATAAYIARENGSSLPADAYGAKELAKLELARLSGPAIYPSLPEANDEEREVIDTDDSDTLQAFRRYCSILAKVEAAQKKANASVQVKIAALPTWPVVKDCRCVTCDDRRTTILGIQMNAYDREDATLTRLREEWKTVEKETGVSYAECDSHCIVIGDDAEKRLNRDAAEASYCHRDPSDWQVRAEMKPESVEKLRDEYRASVETLALQMLQEAQDELDQPYFVDDVQELAEELLAAEVTDLDTYDLECREAKKGVANMWRLLHREQGFHGSAHGRIVTRWIKNDQGRYIRPKTTIGMDEFIAKKVHAAGDELVGLRKAQDSLRFRMTADRLRRERKAA